MSSNLIQTGPPNLTRRQFLCVTGAGLALFHIAPGRSLGAESSPNNKLNIAGIGVGARGGADIDAMAGWGKTSWRSATSITVTRLNVSPSFPKPGNFTDYRVMLDKMGKEIDAVVIGTPDHTHAVIAMEAMRRGKHVYCEKPLAHTVQEVRALMAAARQYKVVTQLGDQGHCQRLHPPVCEWVWAGAIGQVHTVHAGCDAFKNVYCQIRNLDKLNQTYEVPKGLDYDLWIGPVPFRPYTPFWVHWNWRGWMPFGTGTIGDWFCHVMDPSFWALDLDAPDQRAGGGDRLRSGQTRPDLSAGHQNYLRVPGPDRPRPGQTRLARRQQHDSQAAGFPGRRKSPRHRGHYVW